MTFYFNKNKISITKSRLALITFALLSTITLKHSFAANSPLDNSSEKQAAAPSQNQQIGKMVGRVNDLGDKTEKTIQKKEEIEKSLNELSQDSISNKTQNLIDANEHIIAQNKLLIKEIQKLKAQNEKLINENKHITCEQKNIKMKNDKLIIEHGRIKIENDKLSNEQKSVKMKNDKLSNEIQTLKTQNEKLINEHKSIKMQNDKLSNEIQNLKMKNHKLRNSTIAICGTVSMVFAIYKSKQLILKFFSTS